MFSLQGVSPIGTSNGISSSDSSCTFGGAFTLQGSFFSGFGVSFFWGPGSFTGPQLVLGAASFVVGADVALLVCFVSFLFLFFSFRFSLYSFRFCIFFSSYQKTKCNFSRRYFSWKTNNRDLASAVLITHKLPERTLTCIYKQTPLSALEPHLHFVFESWPPMHFMW